ncbi:thioredoxin family protein [Carboxylicivirga sediminis]|uniref:Thioredoxin family protein n=1 Tax=Carboxylicivirga sediminis TaxID=2006564 RepID=A0A941IX84_9BACT|nr:thioredoxin domain-containing protein [Carboxylicivirga sediminis]MBR8535800.1 thioredoxin family protein [Carboxylicivirga sediminis]
MNKIQLLLLMFVLLGRFAYSQGIDFKYVTFEEALQLAKEQDKLLFIDFYTSWCGPCKKLAKGPFMEPEIGDFYNTNFISLKLDAEREGKHAAQLYGVNRYPTLIFVDGDSNLIYRGTGSSMTKGGGMIPFGKSALEATKDQFTLEDMKQLFSEKLDDEAFLKSYYDKLVEYKMNPINALNAWLKVQTTVDESSEEMLEILLKNASGIYLGSKAEEVLTANIEHYLTFASKGNKIRLERIDTSLARTTLQRAYGTQDPEMMRRYIDFCKEKNLGTAKSGELSFYEMEYLRIANHNEAYKKAAIDYVNNIISQKSIKQIKQEDAEAYNKYMEFSKDQTGTYVEFKRELMKQGRIANDNVGDIVKVSRLYWSRCETNADYKHLKKWIKYCYKLIPDSWEVNNLEADVLYAQGKADKAILLKNAAIKNVPFNYKKKSNLEYQLQLMKEGKVVFGKPENEEE